MRCSEGVVFARKRVESLLWGNGRVIDANRQGRRESRCCGVARKLSCEKVRESLWCRGRRLVVVHNRGVPGEPFCKEVPGA